MELKEELLLDEEQRIANEERTELNWTELNWTELNWTEEPMKKVLGTTMC